MKCLVALCVISLFLLAEAGKSADKRKRSTGDLEELPEIHNHLEHGPKYTSPKKMHKEQDKPHPKKTVTHIPHRKTVEHPKSTSNNLGHMGEHHTGKPHAASTERPMLGHRGEHWSAEKPEKTTTHKHTDSWKPPKQKENKPSKKPYYPKKDKKDKKAYKDKEHKKDKSLKPNHKDGKAKRYASKY